MADALKIDLLELRAADTMSFEDAVLHAAVLYARAGFPVLPLEPNSKRLSSSGGINYMSASCKELTVAKWFGVGGKYRGFNVGIGCGTREGVMALDIDAKPVAGTTGLKELAKITEKEGPMPPGPRQRTPSGGYHYLYAWQENAASSSNKVANGIDTRGGTSDRCTGHIVVYPSKVADKQYVWEEGGEVPLMPEWLSESLGKPWSEKPKQDAPKVEVPVHQINRMLTVIDPDNLSYEDWVRVGMALKHACGDDGLELWDNWSETGARRKNGECVSRWKTFAEDGPVGFGTLLFMAKEAGWRPLPGDVSSSSIDSDIEERVLEMNKRYALVRMNKNLLVATFDKNSGGVKTGFLTVQSFQTMAMPEVVTVPTRNGFVDKSMADIWLASPQRREYYDIGIYPGNDEPTGVLNVWNGWGVTPDPAARCDKYLSHMLNIICSGNESVYEWLLDWMADVIQDPRNLKGSCVVLRGQEGCGKGAWADTFGKLFGKHYTHFIDSERLTGKFNSLTADSVLIFADEVLWPGDRKAANVLKGMVTESRVTRESKGVDSVEMDSLMHIIIASNEEWIVPAGPQSRRWLVLNVSSAVAKNEPYFKTLFSEIENGGKEALLYLLMNRKITSNLRLAPKTQGLIDQRRMSHRHDSMLHFFSEVLGRGNFKSIDVGVRVGPSGAVVGEPMSWPTRLIKYELFSEYRTYCNDNRVSVYDTLSMSVFLAKLANYGFVDEGKAVAVPTSESLASRIELMQGVN